MKHIKPITIGILAGMGPRSTAPFLDMVITECQKQLGAKYDIDFPHIIIYSLPTPFRVDHPMKHAAMKKALTYGLKKLEKSGVDFIAMPCNVAHLYFNDIAQSIHVPLLNMVKLSVDQLNPKLKRVALLATPGTIAGKFYQTALSDSGFNYVEKSTWQKQVTDLISQIKAGGNIPSLSKKFQKLITELKGAGIQQAILACTDLNALPLPKSMKIINATHLLAQQTIEYYDSLR